MIKRFTDADKWNKRWFRSLNAQEKVLWFYISEQVTYDGFWEYDEDAVKFYCNGYSDNIPKVISEKFSMHKCDEHQYFLPKWVLFQYGKLKPQVRPHKRIIERIKKKGLAKKFSYLFEEVSNGIGDTKESLNELKRKEMYEETN